MKLTDQDRHRFADHGVLHLRGLIPRRKTEAARESILAELTRLGARVGGKWHTAKMPQKLRHQPQFDDVIPRELLPCLNELAGRDLAPSQPHPQLLLTPPQKTTWSVPHLGWHLDVASPSRDEIPGIQVFALIDDLAPQGGGTVAISGSHKLHSPTGGVAVSAHHALQEDPLYATLFTPEKSDRTRFLVPHPVRGVTVQIIEMCGKAGDVYLMDMRIVHAAAPNATKHARMMLTNRYLSR